MRTLGLDVGDKKIGVAISDPDNILATPLTTLMKDANNNAIDPILDICLTQMHQRATDADRSSSNHTDPNTL